MRKSFKMNYTIGFISFRPLTFHDAQHRTIEIIENSEICRQIVVANTYSVVLAYRDKQFREICESADSILADGQPIIWTWRILGDRTTERIAGPDFMWAFCGICAQKGYRIYLLGGTDENLHKLVSNLQSSYPGINIVGAYSPPFGEWTEDENSKIVNLVNGAKADLLWVGVSTPKQDKWIAKFRSQLQAKAAIGVGAAFDFHSGAIKRAPLWMQRYGLEWLHRFIQDPRRHWRKYLVANLVFIYLALKTIIATKLRATALRGSIYN